jgi:hypothetical protein
MLRREGCRANHKRVERLYREEGLSLRRRRRRIRLSHLRVAREQPVAANQTWAVDFIHDSLTNGRHFRPSRCSITRAEKSRHRSRLLAYRRARNPGPGTSTHPGARSSRPVSPTESGADRFHYCPAAQCSASKSCCAWLLTTTNRIDGRVSASQIASASRASSYSTSLTAAGSADSSASLRVRASQSRGRNSARHRTLPFRPGKVSAAQSTATIDVNEVPRNQNLAVRIHPMNPKHILC